MTAANGPDQKSKLPDIATVEIGGAVIDMPMTSIRGKKLSEALAEVGGESSWSFRSKGVHDY